MPEHTGVGECLEAVTRVGWLVDEPSHPGGAEFTQAEFRAAAPDDVEIVDCPPGGVVDGLDRYVIHNCMQYALEDLPASNAPVVKLWHDVGPWMDPHIRKWLDDQALAICCSPVQAEHMGIEAACIPPAIDLSRFEAAAACVNGNRKGAVCVGSWRNIGKAPHKAAEWGAAHGGVDFYGDGPLAPAGSVGVHYTAMPALLARYETFVYLPTVLEPFGRSVVEAWAAGCSVVTNGLVGARYWIEERPDALETAAEDFWSVVLS